MPPARGMNLSTTHALVRLPSRSLAACELVHLPRQEIDFARATSQHRSYVAALASAGVTVTTLPKIPNLPDAVFLEDVVLILDEVAILCRPGAASRLAEVELIKPKIIGLRPTLEIRAPGTLEGGDVLRVGHMLFVGRSTRTNREGIQQLRQCVAPFGYAVKEVPVTGCLHLKTGVTSPTEGVLLANPGWIDVTDFGRYEILRVPAAEPWGANTLPLNGRVLVAASAPRTADLLTARSLDVHRVDISELQKAEAGLTCLSVIY